MAHASNHAADPTHPALAPAAAPSPGSVARPRITLIGGGLGGALLAAYLGKQGHNVDLFERRPDPAAGNMVGGRSINLALSIRGIHALAEVGAAEEVLSQAVPMRGRMIHTPAGEIVYQPYDSDPTNHINSVGRATLNSVLLKTAEQSNVRVHFDWRCTEVELDVPAAELVHGPTGRMQRLESDLLFGIDGAFSVVRRAMQRTDRFDYSQKYLGHGYKELCIPPTAGGDFAMEPNALHIWPRRSFMMIALPNPDRSFTCTLFFRFEGADSFSQLNTRDDVARFFQRTFADAVPLMPTLLDDFERNPVGSMMTVRSRPWTYGGKVALAGDAAHAVVPFYGQGANASFEDCAALAACLREHAPDWPGALARYERMRKENVDTLADLAIHNFIEMRDHTGSRVFHAKKRCERILHSLLPGVYTPLYTLVSFTRTPYAEALARSKVQNAWVIGIAAVLLTALLGVAVRTVLGGPWLQAMLIGAAVVSMGGVLLRRKLKGIAAAAVADGARR